MPKPPAIERPNADGSGIAALNKLSARQIHAHDLAINADVRGRFVVWSTLARCAVVCGRDLASECPVAVQRGSPCYPRFTGGASTTPGAAVLVVIVGFVVVHFSCSVVLVCRIADAGPMLVTDRDQRVTSIWTRLNAAEAGKVLALRTRHRGRVVDELGKQGAHLSLHSHGSIRFQPQREHKAQQLRIV